MNNERQNNDRQDCGMIGNRTSQAGLSLVIGAGRSGVGAVHLLHFLGEPVLLLEQNEQAQEEKIRASLLPEDRDWPEIVIGAFEQEQMKQITQVIPSPSVPADAPILALAHRQGIPVLSEVELAFRSDRGSVIAITGTNGKTTTTSLVGTIMGAFCDRTQIVGNIGNSYALAAPGTTEDSWSVAEISSFQLEHVSTFRPRVSAILNITPDHLNRHHTMQCYAAVKERITRFQTEEDVCILNYGDPWLRAFGEYLCPARVVWFSSGELPETGCRPAYRLRGREIFRVTDREEQKLLSMDEVQLVGICNAENIMASIAAAEAAGVPMETILRTVRAFPPVEHRIEFVAEKKGVRYYNDSKATNPDAAIQGIRAMDRPTILIGGGYDKNNTYGEWIDSFDGKVKELVLVGKTAQAIAAAARDRGFTAISFADSFEECLQRCTAGAEPGDAVLLSPACASWGMFRDYEQRGDVFKAYVNSLDDEEETGNG